jgi:hypothetical protein
MFRALSCFSVLIWLSLWVLARFRRHFSGFFNPNSNLKYVSHPVAQFLHERGVMILDRIEYKLSTMRIPDDADQRSGMMPITIPF